MKQAHNNNIFTIRKAGKEDVPVVMDFIHKLAEYERLGHEVHATEADLERDHGRKAS